MQSRGEQDGGGAGGHGVHLSPQTHQEYSSDTEGHAEPQLRAGRSTWSVEKNTENHAQPRKKELGGKTGVLAGLDLPSAGGGTETGVRSPHLGNRLSQRRNI